MATGVPPATATSDVSVFVVTTQVSATSTSSTAPTHDGFSSGAIAGLAIGAFDLGLTLAGLCLGMLPRRRRAAWKRVSTAVMNEKDGGHPTAHTPMIQPVLWHIHYAAPQPALELMGTPPPAVEVTRSESSWPQKPATELFWFMFLHRQGSKTYIPREFQPPQRWAWKEFTVRSQYLTARPLCAPAPASHQVSQRPDNSWTMCQFPCNDIRSISKSST
jgi:hypothetical protein